MHDVVAVFGRNWDHGDVNTAEARGHLMQFLLHLGKPRLVEVDQVDLVDRGDKVGDAEKFCDAGVPVGLAQHTGAGVDEQDGDVGIGGPGEHVPRVALVAGRVRQDVAAGVRREKPVSDVDRDALLPLGAQTVGQGGQVSDPFFVGDRLEVVEGQTVGVV